MTSAEIQTMLETSGLPVAYQAFPAEVCPEMPFVVWQETGSNNISADGVVYKPVRTIQIDLLTAGKDETSEAALEGALASVFWNKVQTLNEDEACQRYTYTIEVFGG